MVVRTVLNLEGDSIKNLYCKRGWTQCKSAVVPPYLFSMLMLRSSMLGFLGDFKLMFQSYTRQPENAFSPKHSASRLHEEHQLAVHPNHTHLSIRHDIHHIYFCKSHTSPLASLTLTHYVPCPYSSSQPQILSS